MIIHFYDSIEDNITTCFSSSFSSSSQFQWFNLCREILWVLLHNFYFGYISNGNSIISMIQYDGKLYFPIFLLIFLVEINLVNTSRQCSNISYQLFRIWTSKILKLPLSSNSNEVRKVWTIETWNDS